MKGILLISHGKMASGMVDSATMFFGDDIEQLDCLCLEKDDSPSEFGERIDSKINALDTGDGVVILADLFGGTPCNQAILKLSDNTDVILGMNLAMLIELLASRAFSNISTEELIQAGKSGIKNIKEQLAELDTDEEA